MILKLIVAGLLFSLEVSGDCALAKEAEKAVKVPVIASPNMPKWYCAPPPGPILTAKGNVCNFDPTNGHPDIFINHDDMGNYHGRASQLRQELGPNVLIAGASIEPWTPKLGLGYFKEWDLFFNYRSDSPWRIPATEMPTVDELVNVPDEVPKLDRIHIAMSVCYPFRMEMVQRMCDAGFPLDIYGRCHVRTEGTDCQMKPTGDRYNPDGDWRARKLEILKEYKFALAIENSVDDCYVTEKLYDPLLTNTIPIYWGETNMKNGQIPHPNCYVPFYNFDYIKEVMRSPVLQTLHRRSWRNALSINLFYKWTPSNSDYFKCLCDYYYEKRDLK